MFLSIDPARGKYPEWGPYVYTLDNPLRYVDLNGKETSIYSMPIPVFGEKHTFIVVQQAERISSRGYYPQSRAAAILNAATGLSIKSGNTVVVKPDLPSELGEVQKLQAGEASNVRLEATIAPPKGMSGEEFDNIVLTTADSYPIERVDYNVTGPNSNTMVDNVIESTGAVMPQIPGAQGQDHGESPQPPRPRPTQQDRPEVVR